MSHNIKQMSDREHILHRPAMYIGSVTCEKKEDFFFENDTLTLKSLSIAPGLLKIINEIIDNSIDVAIKTNFKYSNEINITLDEEKLIVEDNGTGIPVVEENNVYLPRLCWGHARAGSNFDDGSDHTQIGMNGIGSFASNVFSKKFIGETDDGKKSYKITFTENASKFKESISDSKKQGTKVTCYFDLEKFNLQNITQDHIDAIFQRVLCLANIFTDIKFKFNKKQIKVKKFQDFAKLFGNAVVYDTENVKFAIVHNESDDFKQFSFVNGLRIPDGGVHIDNISTKIVEGIREKLIKKYKSIKPGDIKNKLSIVCFIKNFPTPKFNSQSKEKLTNSSTEFNSFANITYDKVIQQVLSNKEIIDPIIDVYKIKEAYEESKLLKQTDRKKKIKSEKYFRATGSSKYLMVCEGFSAFGGISKILGNKDFAYYCLKGKMLNTYEEKIQKIMANQECNELISIIKNENFERILIASDMDLDGSHICSLFLTFINRMLPEYKDRIGRLNTPIKMTLKNNKPQKWVYNIQDELEAKQGETFKYFKGLGGWTSELLDYVIKTDTLDKMILPFSYDDDSVIENWMSNKTSDYRKEAIRNYKFSIVSL